MSASRYDRLLWFLLLLVVAGLVAVVVAAMRGSTNGRSTTALDHRLERTLKSQARIALIRELYAPVATLRAENRPQEALLKLAEIEKNYPGEAHGLILRGEIQAQMNALDAAVASYAAAVRASGEYVDRDSPLSQREAIQRLVTAGFAAVEGRLAAHPDNSTALETRKELYYLQSRLAGGCE